MIPTPDAEGDVLNSTDLREQLAALAHEQWSGWMEYLFGKCASAIGGVIIPTEFWERWQRQMATPYAGLSENEKESDRIEADKVLAILSHMEAAHQGEVAALRQRIAALEAALQTIRDQYGQVCDGYELCRHRACQSSHGAWEVADAALNPDWPTAHARACIPTCDGTRPACRWPGMMPQSSSEGVE